MVKIKEGNTSIREDHTKNLSSIATDGLALLRKIENRVQSLPDMKRIKAKKATSVQPILEESDPSAKTRAWRTPITVHAINFSKTNGIG